MKVSFFHLMPYQDLPDDFAEKHHSAWVDLPNENFDPAKGNQYYADYIDQLRYADEVGFDGVCVNEHHNNAYGIMPSPNLIASVLANTTNNGALIVLGNSLALYNPPVRVAEEMAMLDVISGGRLVAGFPVGTSMDTTFSYGQVPITLRERHTEAHDVIMQAWTQRQPTIFNGKYNKLRYISIWPRPMQEPHPPVWIPGSGSLETWDWTIKNDYVYCYLSYSGYKVGKSVLDGFWEEMDRQGKEFNPYHAGFLQLVAVSETDEQAEEYKESIEYFFKKCLHVPGGFANAPGYRSIRSINSGVSSQIVDSRREQSTDFTWLDYIKAGNVIVGSPESVRQELAQAIRELRVGNLMLLLQFGDMPKDLTLKNTELFAKEVMPYVRDIWSEYETRWWPQGLMEPASA
jgi:alkanesulfonate monooxygenase SsuD/methylene tetrahydromethanopterin reductase-like flavin-dependent oxidoreductase (luciferase family)